MQRPYALLLVPMFLATACSSGSSDSSPSSSTAATAEVRVLHASPDAPAVRVLANGSPIVPSLSYSGGSTVLSLSPGVYEIEVEGILPNGSTSLVGPVNLRFFGDTDYTIVATGDAGSTAGITPLVLERDDDELEEDIVRLELLHAAPRAGRVDVYLTAPGVDITTATPVTTLGFAETFGPTELPEGDYQVRVTPAGNVNQIVFDSGEIELDDDDDLVIAAVENTGAGNSPIRLVVLDDDLDDAFEILDADEEGVLRIVHAVPDVAEVDVLVTGLTSPIVEDLDFGESEDDIELEPGTYNVQVTLANQPSVVAISTTLIVEPGRYYTVAAIGLLATNSVRELVIEQDQRRVATQAQLTLAHAAPSAGMVDVWVVPDGANLANFAPALTNVAFADSANLVVPGDDYELWITAPGTTTAVLGPIDIDIDDDGVYTALVRDNQGSGGPFGLILLDDFGD